MGMTRIVVEGKFGGFARECVAGIKRTSAELQLCLNALPRCVWLFYVDLVECVALDGWADNGRGGGDDSAWADMLSVGRFSRLVTTAIWRRATLSASLCPARRA